MYRAVRTGLTNTRRFTTSRCWCDSSSSSSTPYSLPHDAFTSPSSSSSAPPSSSSSSSPSRSRFPLSSIPSTSTPTLPHLTSRQRQKQYLTDSEAQAFADLLGEILPKSLASMPSPDSRKPGGGGGGVFDLFTPQTTRTPTNGGGGGGGIDQIQTALSRKLSRKEKLSSSSSLLPLRPPNSYSHNNNPELTPEEAFELDRMKQDSLGCSTPTKLFEWGLEHVFGIKPPPPPASSSSFSLRFLDPSTSLPETPINPRLYPHLLLHLYQLLNSSSSSSSSPSALSFTEPRLSPGRDDLYSPQLAQKVFTLARSNANSYISGCTSRLYLDVLRSRWRQRGGPGGGGGGDVEGVLRGFEEMHAGGVRASSNAYARGGDGGADSLEEQGFKELVREIGEAIRVDRERTELRVRFLQEKGELGGGGGGKLDEREYEREVEKRRWFQERQVKAWRRLEQMLEDSLEESERSRRERKRELLRLEDTRRELWERTERDRLRDERGGENDFGSTDRTRRYDDDDDDDHGDVHSRYEEEEGKPSLFEHRPSSSSRPSTSTHLHSYNRRARLSPFENVPRTPKSPSSLMDREREWEDTLRWHERDEMRGFPKRPSYANPYKIRRKSLTKEEKSAKDEKHPMLFWRQK